MKRLLALLGATVVSGCLTHVASAQQGAGVVVSLVPASSNPTAVAAGTFLTYNVNISGLKGSANISGSPVVGGYDLTLDFDATFLSLSAVNFNTFPGGAQSYLGPNDFQATDFSVSGQGYFGDFASASAQQLELQEPAAFTLASVTFEALRTGTGSITFDPSSSMSNENGGTLDVVRYTSAAVPEPGTYALALLGAAGLCGYTLRRRHSDAI